MGNSHPVKLTEMVEALERATSRTATCVYEPNQPGDVPLTWADISNASRLLNYKLATSLEEGLRRFVTWYRTASPFRRT